MVLIGSGISFLLDLCAHARSQGPIPFFMGTIGEDVVDHSKIPMITFKMD